MPIFILDIPLRYLSVNSSMVNFLYIYTYIYSKAFDVLSINGGYKYHTIKWSPIYLALYYQTTRLAWKNRLICTTADKGTL